LNKIYEILKPFDKLRASQVQDENVLLRVVPSEAVLCEVEESAALLHRSLNKFYPEPVEWARDDNIAKSIQKIQTKTPIRISGFLKVFY
jgi:hypothetical protein